jgi:hypothetical protein
MPINTLTLPQQQATRLTTIEKSQQIIPQIIHTQVQHTFQPVGHEEAISQIRRNAQEILHHETSVKAGVGNKDNDAGKGRFYPPNSGNNDNSMSHPSSDDKGKRHPRHLGRTPIHNASSNLSHPQKPVKTTKIGDL